MISECNEWDQFELNTYKQQIRPFEIREGVAAEWIRLNYEANGWWLKLSCVPDTFPHQHSFSIAHSQHTLNREFPLRHNQNYVQNWLLKFWRPNQLDLYKCNAELNILIKGNKHMYFLFGNKESISLFLY